MFNHCALSAVSGFATHNSSHPLASYNHIAHKNIPKLPTYIPSHWSEYDSRHWFQAYDITNQKDNSYHEGNYQNSDPKEIK